MTQHLTIENIERYRRREIDPAARSEADTHLATCEACLERVLNSEHSVLAFSSLNEALLPSENEAPFHLSKAELRNYLEGTLDEADKIIYGSHIEDCELCQGEFRAISDSAALESQPVPLAPEQVRSRSLWPSWTWLTPARAAAALAILGILTFAFIQWRRQQLPNDVVSSNSQTNQVGSQPKPPGTEATPGPGAGEATPSPLVVLKDSNTEIRLEHDGKTTGLEGLDDSTQQAVTAALKGEGLPKPKVLAELSSPKIRLLGTPDAGTFRLVAPFGKVIIEEQPTFRWQPLHGATSYVVSVFDENFNRVVQSATVSAPQWTSTVPLTPGHSYSWEVTATREGKQIVSPAAPASAAKFRILEADKQNDLALLERATPVSHLVLGVAYARAGLVSYAEAEFRQLLKENPDSAIAKKLLRAVQGWK